MNLYRYCGDEPIREVDPDGLESDSPCQCIDKSDLLELVDYTKASACDPTNGQKPTCVNVRGHLSSDDKLDNASLYTPDDLLDLMEHLGKMTRGKKCISVLGMEGHSEGTGVFFGCHEQPYPPNTEHPHGWGKKVVRYTTTEQAKHGRHFYCKPGSYVNWLDDSNAEDIGRLIKPFMCKPCLIILQACNIGNGNATLLDRLAKATGCRVVGAGGFASNVEYPNYKTLPYGIDQGDMGFIGSETNLNGEQSYCELKSKKGQCPDSQKDKWWATAE